MSSIRTEGQFQDALDRELAWRIKEISDIKLLVRTSRRLPADSAVRAGIPILYAHWEGFIKRASELYLEYLSGIRLKYEELQTCFVVFGVKRHVNSLVESKNAGTLIEALDFIRGKMGDRAKLKFQGAIRTESNLSSAVFTNIGTSLGLDLTSYEARYKLIDESLLRRRNSIAHGEYLDVDQTGFPSLADEVIILLRMYKTDLENSVSLKQYKKSA